MTARHFSYSDADGVHEAIDPDMASEIDTPAEEMAERYSIPVKTAERILADRAESLETEIAEQVAKRTAAIIGYLMFPTKNLRAMLLGLAFSQGLVKPLNGARDMSAMARAAGCTRALISHYKRRADKLFPISRAQMFGKSAAACATYRKERIAVVEKQYQEKYASYEQ